MGKRRIAVGFFCLAFVLTSCAAMAAQPDTSFVLVPHEGFRDVDVTTPLARILLSEQGGAVRSVFLSFAPYGSKVAELVPGTTTDPKTLVRQYAADAVFPLSLTVNGEREGLYQLISASKDEKTRIFRAVFRGTVAGMTVEKRYAIDPNSAYTISLEIAVTNPTSSPGNVQVTVGYFTPKKDLNVDYLFNGEVRTEALAAESIRSFGGVGLVDKETVFFLAPTGGASASPMPEPTDSRMRRFGISFTANPQTETVSQSTLYAGRHRYLPMKDAGLATLDQHGFWSTAMVWVIQFLDILKSFTGNYGWAIILFTILTRILLYPLMSKQMHSMAKMQRLQPKMKRIQERFKDDKELLQQRIMELYRKEGVNPMSGCLPLVIQLPIIYIIWRALLYASESIHLSSGFLWMPDLSMPDPYFILVIVTTLIMLWQQWKLTPQTGEGGPGAKLFGYVFPVLMAILLWNFPAGLWLYYLLTTASQAGQQAIVNNQLARADRLAAAAAGGNVEVDESDEDRRST